jgi:hypothetical protein
MPAHAGRKDYSILHAQQPAQHYYRIKAVDYAGRFTYSPVMKECSRFSKEEPVAYFDQSGRLVVLYTAAEDETLTLQIVNAAGQSFWKGRHSIKTGKNEWKADVPARLLPGIYFVKVWGSITNASIKLVR